MTTGIAGSTESLSFNAEDFALPDLSAPVIAAMVGHPRFDTAMQTTAAAMIGLYRGQWVLNRLVSDRGRFIPGLMILDLHFTVGGGTGFTTAQLRRDAATLGVCSPGRVNALLASLRLLGFLKPVEADDRRMRRLAPTERFLDLHRDRWGRLFEALALIDADGEAGRLALNNDAFLGAFAHVLVANYRSGARMSDFVPELRRTAERDAGLTMLFSLMTGTAVGQSVSISSLARRFLVSRAHVLTVLREAEEAGLAASAGSGYGAGPALPGALRRFFAIMYLFQLHGIRAAQKAVE
ncbi:MAG TPA: hypothetical protein VH722_05695 [Alphaproteobacteria bacterium]|nr:hypothetical protein [Alphaproteobacteria bacterium]